MDQIIYSIQFWSVVVGFIWILMLIINGEAWPLQAPEKGKEGERVLLGIVLMFCYLELFGVI